jgi:phenylalanyl-tRNA synthetase alpha chain
VLQDLQSTLSNLAKFLLGDNIQTRWVPAYFPFTDPSLELEVYYRDEWMEMLGCGIL